MHTNRISLARKFILSLGVALGLLFLVGCQGIVLTNLTPSSLPERLRFLATGNIPDLFRFPTDMLPVDAEPNRLNDQVLVRYYEREWKDIAH